MPHAGSVAIGVWVGAGGRYEPANLSGVSHFIEHLLFKGTTNRTAREISQAIEGRGGYFNAFTQEESTCYYARVAHEHAWDVLEILTDMYSHPRFDLTEIHKERGVIIEEIMMYRDRPHNLVEELIGELLWSKHPLGRSLLGTPETVRAISQKNIRTFKSSHYVPANTVLVFAGPLSHQDCLEQTKKQLGRLKKKQKPRFARITPSTPQQTSSVISKEIEQTHLAMAVRLFGRHDDRRYAMKLLSVVLGENMSSRLFQSIREKFGLAYSVSSSTHFFSDTGVLMIQAGLDRTRTLKALQLIVRELTRLKDHAIKPKELKNAVDYTTGQIRIGLESTTSQMMWVGENVLSYGSSKQPEQVIENMKNVTTEDIHRVAKESLRRGAVSVAMIAPDDAVLSSKQIMTALKPL